MLDPMPDITRAARVRLIGARLAGDPPPAPALGQVLWEESRRRARVDRLGLLLALLVLGALPWLR